MQEWIKSIDSRLDQIENRLITIEVKVSLIKPIILTLIGVATVVVAIMALGS